MHMVGGSVLAVSVAGCIGTDGSSDEGEPDDPSDDVETDDTSDGVETDDASADVETETITVTQGQGWNTFDPHNYQALPTLNVVAQPYELLIDRGPQGELIPSLATDWEAIDSDRHRVYIREDVSFHNGETLELEDVVYSFSRIIDDDVDVVSPQQGNHPGVVDFETIDEEHAVDIISDGPNPQLFSRLPYFCDIGKKSWFEDRSQSEIAQDMNGTGPFQLRDHEEDVFVELEPFDDYWGEVPDFSVRINAASEDSSRVNRLLAEETDLIVNVPVDEAGRVDSDDATATVAGESNRSIFIAMRDDVEPFSSKEFRQAMNYAVNLDEIIEHILGGLAEKTSQPTLEGHNGYNADLEPYPFDPERAEDLVEESGFAGAEIEIETPVGRYAKDLEVAQAVAGYIDDLSNVSCTVEQRDFAALVEEVQGDVEMSPPAYLLGLGNVSFLGNENIESALLCDGVFTTFCNSELDDLHDEITSEMDDERRHELIEEANALIHEEAPWIFLHRQYGVYGINDTKISSFEPRMDEKLYIDDIEVS